ncbi:MAG: type VI-A CRISPR-associated RNA-guided ribonuclease Cas13a [Candidatus Symbiobacter sp.]|nr:type VI-A CRISPR-associated RNA-guided ribonuclease Cas13a [Candidatus Symbiobacter sp.]
MLYIKPYGRSHTIAINPVPAEGKKLVRQFTSPIDEKDKNSVSKSNDQPTGEKDQNSVSKSNDRPTGEKDKNSVSTLQEKPEFIIATWISMIDKVITKPKGNNFPTPEQKIYRRLLGEACWKLLSKDAKLEPLKDLFQLKLEPYYALKNSQKDSQDKLWIPPKNQAKNKSKNRSKNQPEKTPEPPKYQGRLFAIYFPKESKMDCAAFAAAAENIQKYIEKNRLAAVLKTIAANIHQYRDKPGPIALNSGKTSKAALLPEILRDDWEIYNDKGGDIAKKIWQAFDENKDKADYFPSYGNANAPKTPDGTSTDATSTAAIIRQHYDICFGDVIISVSKKDKPQLFLIHEAVKNFYKQLFDIAAKPKLRKEALAKRMPKDKDALFNLITAKRRNLDYSYLNRMGKVIYYETVGTSDFGKIPDNDTLKKSHYWTSQGQAEIKRNEALVRVWRLVTIQANHSLCLWGNHDSGKDIFGKEGRKTFFDNMFPQNLNNFASLAHHGKFTNGAKRFFSEEFAANLPTKPDQQKILMEWVVDSWTHLRNNGFHFKGRAAFLQVITKGTANQNILPQDQNIAKLVDEFWQDAITKHGKRVKETLVAIKAESYLTQERLNHLYGILLEKKSVDFPLPRLNRVLKRAKNAALVVCFDDLLKTKINHDNLQADDALNCRYQILGLVYKRRFADWLQINSDRNRLIQWIENAVNRSTAAARDLNDPKEKYREFVQSNASDIFLELQKDQNLTIEKFLAKLSSEMASQFSVQKNVYGHDSEKAKDQSDYIDNLKCDVIGQAFLKFLFENDLEFLLNDSIWQNPAKQKISAVEDLPTIMVTNSAEPWQQSLYFLLHLVPVGAVSELLHQLRKWDILVAKGAAASPEAEQKAADELFAQLARVMELYLDMHDVNFSGGEKIEGLKGLKVFFANPDSFTQLYANDSVDHIVPARGLREFMRFGGVDLLQTHNVVTKITDQEIDRYHKIHADIANVQAELDRLHELWEDQKKKTPFYVYDKYKDLMLKRSDYQKLASRLRLTDHLRLHSLLMRVLARLADYAGLWERDQIFVLLALTEMEGETNLANILTPDPLEKFKSGEDPLENFKTGQIVAAVKALVSGQKYPNNAVIKRVESDFQSHFGDKGNYNAAKSYRNNFMHLNMLRDVTIFNFSDWVNHARKMMAYDRKLKNAITLSLYELFKREGLEIKFINRTADSHEFDTELSGSQKIKHLGGKGGIEYKYSRDYVTAARSLFKMAAPPPKKENSSVNSPKPGKGKTHNNSHKPGKRNFYKNYPPRP